MARARSISVQGDHGDADLDFAAAGPKNGGRVHLRAVQEFERWRLTSERLKVDGQETVVDMLPAGR